MNDLIAAMKALLPQGEPNMHLYITRMDDGGIRIRWRYADYTGSPIDANIRSRTEETSNADPVNLTATMQDMATELRGAGYLSST